MSANEIELTFIRCPSCKSLMPSTAVKCGMCGFDLGSGEDDFGMQDAKHKKTRLRQQTFSGEIEDFTSEKEDDNFSRNEQDKVRNDYLNPHEVFKEIKNEEFDEKHNTISNSNYEENDNILSYKDENKKSVLRFSGDNIRKNNLPEAHFNEAQKNNDTQIKAQKSHDASLATKIEPNNDVSDDERNQNEQIKKKRKRKKKKKVISTDNSSIVSEETTDHTSRDSYRPPVAVRVSSAHGIEKHKPITSEAKFRENDSFLDNKPNLLESSNEVIDNIENQNTEILSHRNPSSEDISRLETKSNKFLNENLERNNSQKQSKTNSNYSGDKNMLIGWFVNYTTTSEGSSFEIRSGRQFIGRQSLREDDLIIQDSAISTPHCLLQVDDNGMVRLQDLMSEHGTFVKKQGSNDYKLIESVVELSHGDKIRLGSYELLVCIVPR